jgi:hypothetical protein
MVDDERLRSAHPPSAAARWLDESRQMDALPTRSGVGTPMRTLAAVLPGLTFAGGSLP